MWVIVAFIISILIAAAIIRVFLVKTIFDKLVVLDVLDLLAISLLIVFALIWKESIFVDVAIVYALLSFSGVLYLARYYDNSKVKTFTLPNFQGKLGRARISKPQLKTKN